MNQLEGLPCVTGEEHVASTGPYFTITIRKENMAFNGYRKDGYAADFLQRERSDAIGWSNRCCPAKDETARSGS